MEGLREGSSELNLPTNWQGVDEWGWGAPGVRARRKQSYACGKKHERTMCVCMQCTTVAPELLDQQPTLHASLPPPCISSPPLPLS